MTDDQARVALERQVADLQRQLELVELRRQVVELQAQLAAHRDFPPLTGHWVSSGG